MIPSKNSSLQYRDGLSRLLVFLRLLVHPQGTSPSRGAQDEHRGMIPRPAGVVDYTLSLPPEVDLSSITNSDTSPEHLVTAVRDLLPLLPIGCKLFGQGDLHIVGSYPINAGGLADVWVGKMNNGMAVAIKSYRHYSSSSCLPIYVVSVECCRVLHLLKVTKSGCTRKRWHAVASATTAKVLCPSWGFIPLRNTRLLSSFSSWSTMTSENI